MDKKYIGIITLLCIFLISGSYAIINTGLDDFVVQDDSSDNVTSPNNQIAIVNDSEKVSLTTLADTLNLDKNSGKEISDDSSKLNANYTPKKYFVPYKDIANMTYDYFDHINQKETVDRVIQAINFVPTDDMRNIPGTNIYVKKSVDYTDIYTQCICGGFIPFGNVTKALPEEAICPDACGVQVSDGTYSNQYTYEEALEIWNENPHRVVDQQHLDGLDKPNINLEESQFPPQIA